MNILMHMSLNSCDHPFLFATTREAACALVRLEGRVGECEGVAPRLSSGPPWCGKWGARKTWLDSQGE